MAWPQVYCPVCEKHLSHKAITKRLQHGLVYRCPQCGHVFAIRTS